MKKELTLTNAYRWRYCMETVKRVMRKPMERLADYYSDLLEENISPKQAKFLLVAQIAAFLVIFPCETPLLFRLGCLAWFGLTVKRYNESRRG